MKSEIEEDIAGAGGKQSKNKLDKFGFKPQISLKKMPHILQSSREGCPTACAAMILNYKGIRVSYRELQKNVFNWKRMDEMQLRSLIESYGLKTRPLKNLEEAEKCLIDGTPVIVYVHRQVYATGDQHWIVLRGYNKGVFAVSDPADKDVRRLERKTLDRAMKHARAKVLFAIELNK